MRLKSFYAKTMTEAMQMVRDTLGEDAIIVATQEQKGGTIHVTAAMEPGFERTAFELGDDMAAKEKRAAPSDSWLQYDEEDEESAVSEEITEAMLRHSVPEEVLDHIISCATVIGLDRPGEALIAAIEHLFSFVALPSKAYSKPIMLVGPPGAGKTLSSAKLAARATMNRLKVGVITTDTVRAGGVEQLANFTKLLGADLQKAATPEELATKLQTMKNMDQVIIDTQGINPFDAKDVKLLAKMIAVSGAEPVFVLPCGTDSDESGEMARVFSTIGVNMIMPARIDIARRIGGLLAGAYQGKMAFTDAGNTPKVADGLVKMTPERLAKALMPQVYKNSSQKTGTMQ